MPVNKKDVQNIMQSYLNKTTNERKDVDHPEHYKLNEHGIECIDAIQATMEHNSFNEYLRGTIMKYLWRCNYKNNKKKDLLKAQWYLNKLISNLHGNNS